MYKVKLETFNGNVSVIELPSKGAVSQFLNQYPSKLPAGIAVKVSCDLLGVRGSIVGKAKL
jgi:hypothetical protein